MKNFTLYEGRTINDNDNVTEFPSLAKAQAAFKKSTYAYAVIFEYDQEGDFVNTFDEKAVA